MPDVSIEPDVATQPPAAPGDRVYFPQLDGLRFFAFVLVYLFHEGVPFPILSSVLGPTLTQAFRTNGWVGVQLFFVLSGFLITTLLLREESRFGRIDIRAFWVRRILRIWPLYYLTLFIAFALLPWADGFFRPTADRSWLTFHLPAFLAFLGNWSMGYGRPVPLDAQSILWSVCVEEQFYLLCPVLLAWVRGRARLGMVLTLMAAGVSVRAWLARAGVQQITLQYNSLAHLDTLFSGVLLALVVKRAMPGRRTARFLGGSQWILFGALLWLFSRPNLAHGEPWRRTWDFVAIWLGAVGLVAVSVLRKGWLGAGLANPRLVWLGKISYGLYMYHEVALWIRQHVKDALPWFPNKESLLAIGTFALTVGLASASYYGYERYFLKLKKRWTRVPSRPV